MFMYVCTLLIVNRHGLGLGWELEYPQSQEMTV